MILVDKLFDYFFSEKFVEEGQTFISGVEYREAIEAKIEGDPMADILREKFNEDDLAVSRQQIRDALAQICREQPPEEVKERTEELGQEIE